MLEAFWLLSEGGSIEDIDNGMMDWGFPVGPVVLADEVGIDVGAKVMKIMEAEFGRRMAAPGNVEALVKDNRMGRKNGRGFYVYEEGKKKGPDTSVYALFGQDKNRKTIPKADIQKRVGLAFVNEAARCLEDGVLRSPRDGDIGAIFGLGFPPFRGGPFSYVDHVGASEIYRRLDQLAERHGPRFAPAAIIQDYAKAGKKFR
jgi:3-hydroxyacyl-CoA dehydrogenase/enoyl-CoA hydratase/3-hydroxybutyryl-CoA epimerase